MVGACPRRSVTRDALQILYWGTIAGSAVHWNARRFRQSPTTSDIKIAVADRYGADSAWEQTAQRCRFMTEMKAMLRSARCAEPNIVEAGTAAVSK